MASRIKWSPDASADLHSICEFIAKDSKHYASVFATNVIHLIENQIASFPKSGRKIPEYNHENLREKIYGNYRIIYEIKPDHLEIITICHAARNFKSD